MDHSITRPSRCGGICLCFSAETVRKHGPPEEIPAVPQADDRAGSLARVLLDDREQPQGEQGGLERPSGTVGR